MSTPPRTWLITGAGRGLGRAFAEAAIGAGDSVISTARSPEALAEMGATIGAKLMPVVLDVTDRRAVLSAVDEGVERFGGIDVLVNNAGYGLVGAVEELDEDSVRRVFDVNFFAALWCTQAVLPHMRRRGSGHIFQISSLGGVIALPNSGAYNATKWALEGLSESLALEVAGFGIKVTLVEPGPFRSDWNGTSLERAAPMTAYDQVLAARRDQHSGAHAFTQPGDPAKAAQALLAVLASDNPPLRLLLGRSAAEMVPEAYRRRLEEWAEWEEVSRGADFGCS